MALNSYHNYSILAGALGDDLTVDARPLAGSVEWFNHGSIPVKTVICHPERDPDLRVIDRRIVQTSLGSNDG